MNKDDLNKIAEIVNGVPVFGVLKNYSADKVGIVRGDIITEVNGMTTSTVDEYLNAINFDKDGKRQLKIWRNGQELEIELLLGPKVNEEDLANKIKESGSDNFLLNENKKIFIN